MAQKQAGYRLLANVVADVSSKVTGPLASVDENIMVFDGTTGKLAKDSGVNISEVATSASMIVRIFLRG